MTMLRKISKRIKKLSQAQFVVILSLAVMLAGGVMSFADTTDLTVDEHHSITGKTNTYVFSGESYYKTINGDSTLQIEGINSNSDDTDYAQYDLVIVPTDENDSLDGVSVGGMTQDDSIAGALCYRDNPLAFGSSETVTINDLDNITLDVYVFRAYTKDGYRHNEYITDFFDLQMLQDEQEHNSDINNTALEGSGNTPADYAEIKSYRNIYILRNLKANEELTLNIPCYINLLKSDITLEKPMSVKHNYGGLFAIENITGRINNSTEQFTINTPKAYYETDVYNVFADSTDAQLIKKTLADGSDYTNEILADAAAYIDNFVPKFIFDDITLPSHYHNYGISYTYEVTTNSAFTKSGAVSRNSGNTAFDLSCHIFYNGSEKAVKTISRTVAGTSESALCEVLNSELWDYLANNTDTIDGKIYLTRAVDVKLILDQFIRDSKTTMPVNISFSKSDLFFDINKTGNINLAKNIDTLDMTYSSGYKVAISDSATEPYENVETIILRESKFVAYDQHITVTTKLGSSSGTNNVLLKGLTIEQRNKIIERYKSAVYYTSKNDLRDIINYKADGIYNGPQKVIDSNMGLSSFEYEIYMVDSTLLNEPVDISKFVTTGSTDIAGKKLLGKTADSPCFVLNADDGQLELVSDAITLEKGKSLVLVSTAKYSDDETAGKEYLSYQQIIIPTDGIGGNAYSVYTSGDIFSEEFGNGPYLSFPNPFSSGNSAIRLEMAITTIDGEPYNESTYDYIKIRKDPDGIRSYIDIDITKVPSHNSNVTVKCSFYVGDDLISEPEYPFVIPGIYRLGTDIEDVWVYLRMLETYGDYNGYLRAIDAQAAPIDASGKFDCTQEELKRIFDQSNTGSKKYNIDYLSKNGVITDEQKAQYIAGFSENHSLKGVELLTGTKSMTFDNVKPASLAPFAAFSKTNSKLVELSMQNCGLTSITELINLNNLKKADLDNNSISNIADSLYRTVTELSLSEQGSALVDISDINSLPNLKTLRIENDAIKDFRPLYDLDKLTEVYLAGNCETGGYYGTHGKINLCSYVALIHKGVDIYVENNEKVVILSEGDAVTQAVLTADGYEITDREEYLSVAINSIMNMNTYTDSSTAEADMEHDLREYDSADLSKTNYAATIVTSESSANNYYVVKISDGTVTIYRYIKLNK